MQSGPRRQPVDPVARIPLRVCDGNDPERVVDEGVDEAVLVEPLHLHLVHVRLGGKVRVLVLFQQMRGRTT